MEVLKSCFILVGMVSQPEPEYDIAGAYTDRPNGFILTKQKPGTISPIAKKRIVLKGSFVQPTKSVLIINTIAFKFFPDQ